jgi:hypothetical protein
MSLYWLPHDSLSMIGPEVVLTIRRRPRTGEDEDEETRKRKRIEEEKRRFPKPHFATVGDGVDIRPSTIQNAGNGLFATQRFEVGDPITLYDGELITHKSALELRRRRMASHIRAHIQHRWDLDGSRLPNGTPITDPAEQLGGLGGAAYANHSGPSKVNAEFDHIDSVIMEQDFEKFKRGLDVEFDPKQRYTFLRATRLIEPGDEIFIDYGEDYWRKEETSKNESE